MTLGAALASVLAVRGYVASDGAVPDTRTFPGIRFFPGVGVRGGGKTWHGDAAFIQDLYD